MINIQLSTANKIALARYIVTKNNQEYMQVLKTFLDSIIKEYLKLPEVVIVSNTSITPRSSRITLVDSNDNVIIINELKRQAIPIPFKRIYIKLHDNTPISLYKHNMHYDYNIMVKLHNFPKNFPITEFGVKRFNYMLKYPHTTIAELEVAFEHITSSSQLLKLFPSLEGDLRHVCIKKIKTAEAAYAKKYKHRKELVDKKVPKPSKYQSLSKEELEQSKYFNKVIFKAELLLSTKQGKIV